MKPMEQKKALVTRVVNTLEVYSQELALLANEASSTPRCGSEAKTLAKLHAHIARVLSKKPPSEVF